MDALVQIKEVTTNVREIINAKSVTYDNFGVVASTATLTVACMMAYDWIYHNEVSATQRVKTNFFTFIKSLPYIKDRIREQIDKEKDAVRKQVSGDVNDIWHSSLPTESKSFDEITQIMQRYVNYDTIDWEGGKLSGTTFTNDAELSKLCEYIYRRFSLSNPLHPDVFRSVRKMEAEILAMTLSLYKAPSSGCGIMTSGGSESLGLAVLAARNKAFARGVKWPELVMCRAVHCGIDKACHYFRVKVVKVDYDYTTMTASISQVKRNINRNTCMIVGSAPDYAHGLTDNLEALAKVAEAHNVPMHVDACMGGFLLPFAKDAGFPLDPFDFTLPGVTSISADVHKYGSCPKGASVLMFRNNELRSHAFFNCTDWPGGIYVTPTYCGSRPGGNIAVCWGVMNMIGHEGYVKRAHAVISSCRRLRDAVHEIDGLTVIGNPNLCICSMTSSVFDIYALLSEMKKAGWTMGAMQYPPAIHLDITNLTTQTGVMDSFIKDLIECTARMYKLGTKAAPSGAAAIYGKATTIPDRSIVAELAQCFVETNASVPT